MFLSIRNRGDEEAAGIIYRLRNAGLVLLLAFCSIADYGDASSSTTGVSRSTRSPRPFRECKAQPLS